MSDRKTYTLEDFKGCKGRRVLVEATIYEEPDMRPGITLRFSPGQILPVAASAIREILPAEIKVGDRVNWFGSVGVATVLHIHGRWAWLDWAVDDFTTADLSDLTLSEPAQ